MYVCLGKMAEWSNAAVLKTVGGQTSGGSNPSLSAEQVKNAGVDKAPAFFLRHQKTKKR